MIVVCDMRLSTETRNMKKPLTKKILKATDRNIKIAARLIRRGGVVAFPTETVYGLGASVFDKKAVARIFEIKKRPHFDPLIVHICEKKQLNLVAKKPSAAAKRLMDKFWPGPLTLVLPKKAAVPDIVTAGLPTVAVRMPNNKIALELIKKAGTPLAAPSANLFTRLSPTKASHVREQLGEEPDLILDGGRTRVGVESTILKYEKGAFHLLRPGGLGTEEIENTGARLIKGGNLKKIEAPGQFKKHYAPSLRLILVDCEKEASPGKNYGYIAFQKKPAGNFSYIRVLSKTGDLSEAAANLFEFLHEAEKRKLKILYAECPPAIGIGKAIRDRLSRGSGN